MRPILEKDYVDLKLDTERHVGGEAEAKRLTGGRSVGYPWSVILDSEGKALINSEGPGGNIGCPVSEAERGHFIEMIRASRQRITDEELTVLERELAAYAKEMGR